MSHRAGIDYPLLILLLLLAGTLIAFFTGLFPYPFGFIVITLAIIYRLTQLNGVKP